MRRCICRVFSDRTFYAAVRRFSGTRRPCAGLLDMPNVRCFLWRRLNRHLAAQFRNCWLFTDARRFMLGKIFHKANFWWLCMNILRGRFFCAGFLCLPYIRTPSLFLRRWHGGTLRLLCVRSYAHVLRAQARRFLGWQHIGYKRTLWQRFPNGRFRSIFCRLLNVSTPPLLLRCWGRHMPWRFRFGAQSYIVCAETGCFRNLPRRVFQCRHGWGGRIFPRHFWRDRRCYRCLCRLLDVCAPSLLLRCRGWHMLRRFWPGA